MVIRKPFRILKNSVSQIICMKFIKINFNLYNSLDIILYLLVFVSFSWVFGLLWSILPFFGQHQYVLEGCQTSCTFDYIDQTIYSRLIMVSMNLFGFFMPISIILSCYLMILFYLKKNSKYIKANTNRQFIIVKQNSSHDTSITNESKVQKSIKLSTLSASRSNRKRSTKKYSTTLSVEIQITKKTFLIVTAFCIAWIPYALMSLIGQFSNNRHEYITPFSTLLPALFAKTSSVLNPMFYIFNSIDFRKKFNS